MRPLIKTIDLSAIRENLAIMQRLAAPAKIMAVVKADAYGHGVVNVLPAFAQAEQLAVACIEEALELRDLGAKQPIVLLEGVFEPQELALCRTHQFVPFIHHQRQIDWLKAEKNTQDKPLSIWVKIDSGMRRLGIPVEQAQKVIADIQALASVNCEGVATHLACADEEDLAHTKGQLSSMEKLNLPHEWQRCYANSAAIFRMPTMRKDWVRPGLALYGMSPICHQPASALGLRAAMTLTTEIITIHSMLKGDTAGYGQGFSAPTDGLLATIAFGYGDGFPRNIISGSVQVRIKNRLYPIVGRVSMDMALVWLGSDSLEIGSKVTLWGDGHDIEARAREANTIPYTLTTGLTSRIRTEVING